AVETAGAAVFSGRSAAIAAIAALGGRADGTTLAVLGYGRVGSALAARFAAAGGRLVAVSTARGAAIHPVAFDPAQLARLCARYGDDAPLRYSGARAADPEELFALGVDVLAPCATVGMIDAALARRARCRVVSSGANGALTADAEAVLGARGVSVVPDFVADAGGRPRLRRERGGTPRGSLLAAGTARRRDRSPAGAALPARRRGSPPPGRGAGHDSTRARPHARPPERRSPPGRPRTRRPPRATPGTPRTKPAPACAPGGVR